MNVTQLVTQQSRARLTEVLTEKDISGFREFLKENQNIFGDSHNLPGPALLRLMYELIASMPSMYMERIEARNFLREGDMAGLTCNQSFNEYVQEKKDAPKCRHCSWLLVAPPDETEETSQNPCINMGAMPDDIACPDGFHWKRF